ncbi:hypothetical protein L2E82_24906 [Cichorium intybus]|uniref:Uncharacterized protein n=1 Tax=Cichorium intybus TaxID=13427 RepID=A0ACB9E243_CICIN|nr:hypothetical protein L2E82_24906 [Cichorium intybus]
MTQLTLSSSSPIGQVSSATAIPSQATQFTGGGMVFSSQLYRHDGNPLTNSFLCLVHPQRFHASPLDFPRRHSSTLRWHLLLRRQRSNPAPIPFSPDQRSDALFSFGVIFRYCHFETIAGNFMPPATAASLPQDHHQRMGSFLTFGVASTTADRHNATMQR